MIITMTNDTEAARAERARNTASRLFPAATWTEIEPRVFLAKSREPRNKRQFEILEKERVQARLLVSRGSTVYLLPEPTSISGEKHPDAVVDGFVMEFKTVTGSIEKVEKRFKGAREKTENVFLKIDSDLTTEEVLSKLKWICYRNQYKTGALIVYFTSVREFHYIDIADFV
jgi:hypothetical protein